MLFPALKTPPAFHDQRRQLERAKTGDMLKAKIQQRPARHELERRHILEAEPVVDPSLAEKQRMLKKARLADQLNDQLSHRPGPLELIQKNILHTEEPIEEAVKTGKIPFRATCEGQITKPQHPNSYITYEEDSQSSEGDNIVSPGSSTTSDVLEAAAKSAGIVVSLAIPSSEGQVVVTTATPVFKDSDIVFADLCRTVNAPTLLPLASVPSPASLVSSTSTLSPLSSVASPLPSTPVTTPIPVALKPQPSPLRSDAPGKDKNRKKSKNKSAPKTRTIKFHEYKGPPNALKNSNSLSSSSETPYELLLKQQQLFLQWQVSYNLQHKFPKILPAAQKPIQENTNQQNNPTQQSPVTSTTPDTISTSRLLSRLEDMKVSDLKQELKRRNLPVSGSKPQLIERLKPFLGNSELVTHSGHIIMDTPPLLSVCSEESQCDTIDENNGSPHSTEDDHLSESMDISEPKTPAPTPSKEDIVREQQRQIEELRRKLTLSQLQLQQVRALPASVITDQKAQRLLQQHLQARHQQQFALQAQQLQAFEEQQRELLKQQEERQQQHVAFQNSKNLTNRLLLNENGTALILNQLVQGKVKLVNGQRANSLPNFLNTIPVVPATVITTPAEIIPTTLPQNISTEETKPPPPLYEEATKQIEKEKNSVKSQSVSDVLEILIKNGDLPASAAQDPNTPNSATPILQPQEPIFPVQNQNHIEPNDNYLGLDTSALPDLGLDLESLDAIDFSQFDMDINMPQNHSEYDNMNVPMETDDSDFIESFLPMEQTSQNLSVASIAQFDSDMSTYDPLLANTQDPFDLFSLEEFKSPADLSSALSWDKVDFAT